MNREFMLAAVRERIKELYDRYMYAIDNETCTGKQISKMGGACLRSRLKKDICCLKLVEELLVTSKAVYITDEDAVLGFERLTGVKY